MHKEFYDFSQEGGERYRFISRGKRTIDKIAGFSPTSQSNIYNLWFGDLLPDGTIDDMAISDNGDTIKILATLVRIIIAFTAGKPHISVAFRGNTIERMHLYERTLKSHYEEFSTKFKISASIIDKHGYKEIPFNPHTIEEYLVFFVKRKR